MTDPRTIAGKIATAVGTGRGRLLCAVGIVLMLFSAVVHANLWHVLSAVVFGSSMWLLCLAAVRDLRYPRRLSSSYARVLDRVALPALIIGAYVPFSILAVKGEREWAILSLLGTMALLWVVLDAVVVFKRRLIGAILHLVIGWTAIALVGPLLSDAPHLVITVVLAIGLLVSFVVVAAAVASVPRAWKSWRHVYPVLTMACMSMLGVSDLIERGSDLL